MRTPRVARETSRFFDASSTTVTPRRVTRSSLARFAYNGASNIPAPGVTDNSLDNADSEITFGSDIEDAIVKKTTPATRKRKRTATELAVVQPSPRRAPTTTTMTTRATTRAEIKTEIKAEEDPSSDVEADTKPPRPRGRARKPARKTTDAVTGATTVEPPSDWEEIYSLVKEMRLTGPAANAAVDTMGCERLAHPAASARDRRFHTLVALMLSSQTKDTVNAEAMARLQAELPPHEPGALPGLTLENMLAVDPAVLNELIGKVGFHNNKTKYLKQTAAILRDKFNSDIPDTIEGLVSLPGVGPKMAHLCMSADNGWGRVEGIGVDVHVHRITNLWGWQGRPGTKTPEETRLALQAWLPRDKWKEINWLLVGFGQSVCLPVGPKCGDCELGLRGLCKAADRKKVNEGIRRRQRSVLVKEDERVKVEVVKAEPEPEPELERNVVGWEGMEGGGLVKCEEEDMEIDQVKEEKIKIDEIEVEGNADTESKQATKKGERVGDRENTPVIKKEEKIDVDDEEGMKITGESVVNTDLERAVTIKKEDEMAVDEAEIEVSGETDMKMEDKQAVKMEGEMEIDEVKPSVEDKAGDMECEQVIKNEEKMEVDEAKLKVKGERDENTESKHAIKREGKIEVGEVKPAVNGEGVGERDGELLMQSIEVDEVKVEVKGDMELGIKKEEGSMDIDEVKGGINVCGDGEVLVKKEEEKEDVVGWASHSSSYLREASARVKSEASRA